MPTIDELSGVDERVGVGGAHRRIVHGRGGVPRAYPLIPMGVLVGELAETTADRWAALRLAEELASGRGAGIAMWLAKRWEVRQRRNVRRRRLCWWDEPEYWQTVGWAVDPDMIASAWETLCWHVRTTWQRREIWGRGVVDIGLRRPLDPARKPDDAALAEQLCAAAWEQGSGVGGLYFEQATARRGPGRDAWHWPLRVGFLDDPDSQALRALYHDVAEYHDWPRDLTRVVEVERTGLGCDLLLSPRDAEETAGTLRRARARASAAVFLGEVPLEVGADRTELLCKDAGLSATSFVGVTDPGGFLRELIREISHDQYFDAAVFAACRASGAVLPPLVFGGKAFIDSTRISERAETMAIMAAANGRFEAATAMRSAKMMPFNAESGAATDVLNAAQSHEPRKPMPRYLNAEVYRADAAVAALAPRAWSRVGAWLGLQPRRTEDRVAAFPDHEIAWDGGPVTLTIALTAPGFDVAAAGTDPAAAGEAAVTQIVAAPQGESDRAWFDIRPREGTENLRARIAVLHGNRVLQTAILTGTVGEAGPVGATTIRLETEGVIRADLQDLDDRREFDLAILTNHGLADGPQFTGYAGEQVVLRDFADLSQIPARIDRALQDLVHNPDSFRVPDSEAATTMLRRLANEGVLIRDALIDVGFKGVLTRDPERIQLVSARSDSLLPVEFIYDGDAPDDDAPACSGQAAALAAGSCGDCRNRTESSHVCAMRFWGLRKVIERQIFDPDAPPERDVVRMSPSPDGKGRLRPPGTRLFACAERATQFDGGPAAIDALRATLGGGGPPLSGVGDWLTWIQKLKDAPAEQARLLVLLPHTGSDEDGEYLEIGAGQHLYAAHVNRQVTGKTEPALVLLLGCETAVANVTYARFIARFRQAGASVVVATLAPVLGRHVAPVAAALASKLEEYWKMPAGGVTVADAIVAMRRDLLLRGLPVGLAVVAIGDADWLVGA